MKLSEWLKNNAQTISVFVIMLLVWHFGVILLGIKEYILPTPWAAIKTLFEAKYRWPKLHGYFLRGGRRIYSVGGRGSGPRNCHCLV